MGEKMGIFSTAEVGSVSYKIEILPLSEIDGWQVGTIDPGIKSDEELARLAEAVSSSITAVDPAENAFSDCTDGRLRMNLADGISAVPVREKLVGTDTMTALAMADALGSKFYGNEKATAKERIGVVVDFLKSNNLSASTHEACGAAGGYVPVTENSIKFAAIPAFRSRIETFVPVYEEAILETVVEQLSTNINNKAYEGYSDQLITDAVMAQSGPRAIARYADTGRGVHGHEELVIARLQGFEGQALDTNRLAEKTDGSQVFSINDNRLERLAGLFGRGHDRDYATAYVAGELFTDAGHGSLGHNLRTIVIRSGE